MIPFKLDMPRDTLDAWGTPEDIGSTTLSGDVRVFGKILFGDLATPISGGLYAATQGSYSVIYPFHEHATLLDGRLALTDKGTGVRIEYGPGDSWIIGAGTEIVWEILSAEIRKSYLAITPN